MNSGWIMHEGLMRCGLATLLAASWLGTATAQDGVTPEPEVVATDGIEVRGERRLKADQVRTSVQQLGTPLAFTEVVPRFHEAVCPKVVGVDPKIARIIEARISAVAAYVELPEPKAKCSPNAFVLILEQPPEMFEKIISKRFGLLGPSDIRDRHISAIRADLKAGKPVVAWNQIATRNFDGPTISDGSSIPVAGGGFGEGVLVTQTPFASRLRSSTLRAKERAVVIIDMKQLADVQAVQLADLASLYIFGWPRRNIDFDALGTASLLTLFRDGPKASPVEMTDFDRAYLKGVYALQPNERSNRLNRSVLAAYDAQCTEEAADCAGSDPAASK